FSSSPLSLLNVSGGLNRSWHFPNSCSVASYIKYVLIGVGIGLFLVAGFIILKVCSIRKQVHDNVTENDLLCMKYKYHGISLSLQLIEQRDIQR
uniref:Uncharacterized protein n=1 Tax=Dicentrarchus labrax TaxID=13489 RepID=A0A8C4NJZ0_DICLA